MFPFPIATPQGCDIQTFYGPNGSANVTVNSYSWSKPVGVSHVYMMLIGAGGNGDGSSIGGGSGAVTVWYGAAQHVPNFVQVRAGVVISSQVYYWGRNQENVLLTAAHANNATAGAAMTANYFTASGFFQSTAGQAGASGAQSASATTFLSGGSGGVTTGNYGYTASNNRPGYFMMRPIIVGVGSSSSNTGVAGFGCGSGYSIDGGGPGMVLIASW
jgi:hypothetical protein